MLSCYDFGNLSKGGEYGMTITNVLFPVRVGVTPMAGANNSTLRRDSAVSAADEHETLNREDGNQVVQRRRIFNHYENILHPRRTLVASYLLTISNNLMFSSSVTSAFAKPLRCCCNQLMLEKQNAAKHARQKVKTFTIPYFSCELPVSPCLVEAA
jgi:hypothetical protein